MDVIQFIFWEIILNFLFIEGIYKLIKGITKSFT